MSRRSFRLAAAVSALALVLAACGNGDPAGDPTGDPTGDPPPAATGEPIRVAVLTSTSGPLLSYGNQYVDGFRVGLEYATNGTMAIGDRPIEVDYLDDAGDPEQATSTVTQLVGEGVTIIAGTVVSGVALQIAPLAEQENFLYISGPAAVDAVTGINGNTFRSGRQTFQDITTSAQFIGDVSGQRVTVFAQDTAFGQANVAGVQGVLGAAGADVDSVLVPGDVTEFTPFARQVADNPPDLLFVAWAGETAPAMWQTLDQQGVFDATTVATGLDQRASYETFGPVADQIDFLSHYVAEAPDNEVNQYLVDNLGSTPDLFTPDGFVAAQMVVRALTEAADENDIDGMIAALEGWTFDAPKGSQTIRADDHAMLQPMFQIRLVEDGGEFTPTLVETYPADVVAPPVAG